MDLLRPARRPNAPGTHSDQSLAAQREQIPDGARANPSSVLYVQAFSAQRLI